MNKRRLQFNCGRFFMRGKKNMPQCLAVSCFAPKYFAKNLKLTSLFIPFLICLFVGLLSSCANVKPSSKNSYVWPKPPDIPRVVYEYTLKNNKSLLPDTGEDRLRSFATGHLATNQSAMAKPYDIAASNGLIVVTDSFLNVAFVFDVPNRKMFPIGWRKEGKLGLPLGVDIDAEQNIYIVDAGRGAVVKYDRLGLYLDTVGEEKDFARISDVAISAQGDKIYILDRGGVDSNSHQILVFDNHGKKLKTIGRRGHKAGEFNHPTQLAVGGDGRLYVLDSGNFRVQVFDKNGVYLNQWGRAGNKIGNFARPRGIAVDAQNRVFVTDGAFQNFQIFNSKGQLLLSVGDGGGRDMPGRYMLPAGIAVDETQRVYVVDQIRKKIEVYRMLNVTTDEK